MAEITPRPPASPDGPPLPTTPASPPGPGIVRAFVAVLARPKEFFESVRGQTGFGAPIVFALVMGLLAGVLSALLQALGVSAARGPAGALAAGTAITGIVLSPIIAVVFGSFVCGAIVHVVSLIANGKGTFEQSVRIASYSMAVLPIGALLGFVSLLPILANLYGLWIVAAGIIAIHNADRSRTLAVVGVLGVLVVLLGIAGAMIAGRARSASAELQDRYGPNSEFQRDIDKARDEMQRAAEEMQRAADRARQRE